MSEDDSACPDATFPTTVWTLVNRAGQRLPDGGVALVDLLGRYLPALKAFLMHDRRLSSAEADEILQDFVEDKIVERNLLASADRARGRFRTFLVASLRNYRIDHARKAAAQQRRLGGRVFSLEHEVTDRNEPGRSPADVFDVTWARQTLSEAVTRMRAECETSGRPHLWEIFRTRLLDPSLGTSEPLAYDELVARFGFRSPSQASNALITTKRMFVRILRAIIGEYAGDPADVDQEIGELKKILSRAGA